MQENKRIIFIGDDSDLRFQIITKKNDKYILEVANCIEDEFNTLDAAFLEMFKYLSYNMEFEDKLDEDTLKRFLFLIQVPYVSHNIISRFKQNNYILCKFKSDDKNIYIARTDTFNKYSAVHKLKRYKLNKTITMQTTI